MPLSDYKREHLGTAALSLPKEVEAGSLQRFRLTYTAGFFGIDDSGSIKICWRFASDLSKPQFDDPESLGFTHVTASNGAVLDCRFDPKMNIRPWGKTLYIKVVRGYLQEGDELRVDFGGGPARPGCRMQTFCEDSFEYKVLVDAFATCDYAEIIESPTVRIVPGPPLRYRAVLPTLRRVGEPFRLGVKAEDCWGNPTGRDCPLLRIEANRSVEGLPRNVQLTPREPAQTLEGLRVTDPGDLMITLVDPAGEPCAESNPCRFVAEAALLPFWADLHGQSEETIGTNTAKDYFRFGRDCAFLDAQCHQGNDFQITEAFWEELNRLTQAIDEPGRFVAFPGYEWSGNTAKGGDHNVIFRREGESIHRSCRALVPGRGDTASDCYTIEELHEALAGRDFFLFAHVGGRYADLARGRTALPKAVEVHSAWGTFEWLLHDALEHGQKPGIVANSDGHKGRPGASYPGASMFGSYGGLTCFLCPVLSREAIFDALHRRRHYATTGARMLVDVVFDAGQTAVGMGGDIPRGVGEGTLAVEVQGSAPIVCVELFDGPRRLAVYRPYSEADLGRRIRVLWEGAEYRGRGRETRWDGEALFEGSPIARIAPINFWNPERPLEQSGPQRLCWKSITTGGFCGFDAWLDGGGAVRINTPLAQLEASLEGELGMDPVCAEAGGLGRRLSVLRLPEILDTVAVRHGFPVRLEPGRSHALYLRLTQEDGHRAWTSPIYQAD